MDSVELLGRFEALAKYVLQLTAELEMQGLIDGPRFSDRLRGADRTDDQLEYMRVARQRLSQLADALDQARETRNLRSPR